MRAYGAAASQLVTQHEFGAPAAGVQSAIDACAGDGGAATGARNRLGPATAAAFGAAGREGTSKGIGIGQSGRPPDLVCGCRTFAMAVFVFFFAFVAQPTRAFPSPSRPVGVPNLLFILMCSHGAAAPQLVTQHEFGAPAAGAQSATDACAAEGGAATGARNRLGPATAAALGAAGREGTSKCNGTAHLYRLGPATAAAYGAAGCVGASTGRDHYRLGTAAAHGAAGREGASTGKGHGDGAARGASISISIGAAAWAARAAAARPRRLWLCHCRRLWPTTAAASGAAGCDGASTGRGHYRLGPAAAIGAAGREGASTGKGKGHGDCGDGDGALKAIGAAAWAAWAARAARPMMLVGGF